MNKIIIILLLGTTLLSAQTSYWVSSDADGSGDGTSQLTPWTFAQAASSTPSNSNVYIKAGNYGGQTSNVKINITASGTLSNPINFIGCDSSWTPITNTNQFSTYTPSQLETITNGDNMPYLEGFRYEAWDKATNTVSGVGTVNDFVGEGVGISLNGQYVNLKNIIVKGYQVGVSMLAQNCILDNVMVSYQGDFDRENSYDLCIKQGGTHASCTASDSGFAFANYTGTGIIMYSANNTVSHSTSYNGGAEGIRVRGVGSRLNNNLVWSEAEVNETDYHYQISYTDNVIIEDCEVYNAYTNQKRGHGFASKYDVTNLTLINCKAINTRFEFQFEGVNNNKVIDCEIVDGLIAFSNGSNNNYVENLTVTGVLSAGSIYENWAEGQDLGGYDNYFYKCNFLEGKSGIDFNSYSTNQNLGASNNIYKECVFKNLDALFKQDRENTNTIIRDSEISDVTKLVEDATNGSICYPIDVVFENVTFSNNGFSEPVAGSQALNPCASISGLSKITKHNYKKDGKRKYKLRM